MPIFKIEKNKLDLISEKKIALEKDIQKITEENLSAVFGLEFVSSEFDLQNFRIDTLAFNEETKSFVIIEYKRDRSFSVVDQGFAYLSLMLNNKADFILEFNERTNKSLKREDVDWSQSKVIFIANSFTVYQQNAINFKDLPIELQEVKMFDNDTVYYNQLISPNSQESINKLSGNKEIESVSKQVKKYTIDDHFKKDWELSRNIFDIIREKILDLDSRIVENPVRTYIGYKIGNSNLTSVHPYKSKIVVAIPGMKPNDFQDPEKKAILRKNSFENFNQYITDVEIKNEKDIDYALFLIRQKGQQSFK
jgi:predicted transport protein